MIEFTIYGRLPGMNEYTKAQRSNKYAGANLKRRAQDNVQSFIFAQIGHKKAKGQVFIHYRFYEPNMKRDLDNISAFAHKVIQDALVEIGVIENDGWKNVKGFEDDFFLDKKNPRIEVMLEEVDERH